VASDEALSACIVLLHTMRHAVKVNDLPSDVIIIVVIRKNKELFISIFNIRNILHNMF